MKFHLKMEENRDNQVLNGQVAVFVNAIVFCRYE